MSKALQYKDSVTINGFFCLRGYDREGHLVIEDTEEPNMIMEVSKEALAHLIGGDEAEQSVTHIAFGNVATAPTPSDASIGGIAAESIQVGSNNAEGALVVYKKTVRAVTYPVAGQVAFEWVLDYGEANGLALTEYALMTGTGTMFSRKTRGLITKDSDLALEGIWTIRF